MPRSYICHPKKNNRPSGQAAEDLGLPVRGRLSPRLIIGRREWLSLPQMGVSIMTAKVDTGAYTSSLHAYDVEQFTRDNEEWVRFSTQSHHGEVVVSEARIHQRKKIKSSTGEGRKRIIISTEVETIGGFRWEVLFSLADRSVMKCPMLLGRRALSGYFVVDTQASHLFGNLNDFSGKIHTKHS